MSGPLPLPEDAAGSAAEPTTSHPNSAPPPPSDPPVNAWPRSAQLTLALLLGASVVLLGWRYFTEYLGARPAELHRPTGGARVDLNRAGKTELLQLPGIGPQLADHILAYREANGPFRRIEDLKAVPRLGDATVMRIQPWVHIDPPIVDEETPGGPDDEPLRLLRKPTTAQTVSISSSKPLPSQPIDVNSATLEDLQRLPGIGPVMARRIADERAKKPFTAVEDLRRVSGIGPKTLEKIRPYVSVGQ
jgi:competence protein ComEA